MVVRCKSGPKRARIHKITAKIHRRTLLRAVTSLVKTHVVSMSEVVKARTETVKHLIGTKFNIACYMHVM